MSIPISGLSRTLINKPCLLATPEDDFYYLLGIYCYQFSLTKWMMQQHRNDVRTNPTMSHTDQCVLASTAAA
jgi:hypothetical protein